MSQGQVAATKTLRQPLERRPAVSAWLVTTQALFNQVASFYFQVLDAHPGVLDLPASDALTTLERLTHATAGHPTPVMPLSEVATQVPALFRRAAIHAALGAQHSFQSHLARWRRAQAKAAAKGKPYRVRPPVPPRAWNCSVVLYAGMWKPGNDGKEGTEGTAGRVTLKLYDGQTWRWVRVRVFGRHVPEGWERGSPQVVRHGMRWWLHTPITQAMPRPQKVATQLAADTSSQPLLCAVDLNINDALAVCTIQQTDGTVLASRFFRGGNALHGRRKSLLGRTARNRRLTGIIAEGEQDNTHLWAKIRHLDEETAHRLSRRIVDFAHGHGASILVFEHLGSFRPERGRYSRRANAKRSFWLRGRIVAFSRYKAWNQGILTCRVNPRNTSRHCARCILQKRAVAIARYGSGKPREGYQPGAPLAWCPVCQQEVNADHNASRNIGQRLVARHQSEQHQHQHQPMSFQEKPPTRPATGSPGEAPKGAGGLSTHAAAGPGGRTWHGTA